MADNSRSAFQPRRISATSDGSTRTRRSSSFLTQSLDSVEGRELWLDLLAEPEPDVMGTNKQRLSEDTSKPLAAPAADSDPTRPRRGCGLSCKSWVALAYLVAFLGVLLPPLVLSLDRLDSASLYFALNDLEFEQYSVLIVAVTTCMVRYMMFLLTPCCPRARSRRGPRHMFCV